MEWTEPEFGVGIEDFELDEEALRYQDLVWPLKSISQLGFSRSGKPDRRETELIHEPGTFFTAAKTRRAVRIYPEREGVLEFFLKGRGVPAPPLIHIGRMRPQTPQGVFSGRRFPVNQPHDVDTSPIPLGMIYIHFLHEAEMDFLLLYKKLKELTPKPRSKVRDEYAIKHEEELEKLAILHEIKRLDENE